jgi:hypothetical protein
MPVYYSTPIMASDLDDVLDFRRVHDF